MMLQTFAQSLEEAGLNTIVVAFNKDGCANCHIIPIEKIGESPYKDDFRFMSFKPRDVV